MYWLEKILETIAQADQQRRFELHVHITGALPAVALVSEAVCPRPTCKARWALYGCKQHCAVTDTPHTFFTLDCVLDACWKPYGILPQPSCKACVALVLCLCGNVPMCSSGQPSWSYVAWVTAVLPAAGGYIRCCCRQEFCCTLWTGTPLSMAALQLYQTVLKPCSSCSQVPWN